MRLAWRGALDGAEQILRTPADADDGQAAQQLGNLLAKRGLGIAGGYLPGLIRTKTNRRPMIGDHHGQTARTANL